MNIIKEIEITRSRLLNEINTEMDLLLKRVKEYSYTEFETVTEEVYESILPLSDNPAVFKGKKPIAVIFATGKRVEAHTWKQAVTEIMKDCISDKNKRDIVESMCGKLAGNKRVILSKDNTAMTSPLEIDENLYLESHYDAETMLKILTTRILDYVGYDYTKISIALRK